MDFLSLQKGRGGGVVIISQVSLFFSSASGNSMKLVRDKACVVPFLYNSISTRFFREWIQDPKPGS